MPEISKSDDNRPSRPDARADQRLDLRDDLRAPEGLALRFAPTQDKYGIPDKVIAYFKGLGWELEWKRASIQGAPEDYYETDLRMNHWQPVLVEKYPAGAIEALAPFGQKQGPIRKSDQMLMMRPSYLCDEARELLRNASAMQLIAHRKSMVDAPKEQAPRVSGGKIGPPIQKVELEPVK